MANKEELLDAIGNMTVIELAEFVDRVREATGAETVDLIGYSQGTIMPAVYVNDLGGRAISPPSRAESGRPSAAASRSSCSTDPRRADAPSAAVARPASKP